MDSLCCMSAVIVDGSLMQAGCFRTAGYSGGSVHMCAHHLHHCICTYAGIVGLIAYSPLILPPLNSPSGKQQYCVCLQLGCVWLCCCVWHPVAEATTFAFVLKVMLHTTSCSCCRFYPRHPVAREVVGVMQALLMMWSLRLLQLPRSPRILGHVLCTPLCLLFLESTGALLTLQAAASLTSPVLHRQVCQCFCTYQIW